MLYTQEENFNNGDDDHHHDPYFCFLNLRGLPSHPPPPPPVHEPVNKPNKTQQYPIILTQIMGQ